MAEDTSAVVIFVDVRGFTKWAEANEVFINLDSFISGFLAILRRRFVDGSYHLKPLGDGALLVQELPADQSQREVTALLARILATVGRVERDFAKLCLEFAGRVGHSADLRLGWGIVRGKVLRVRDDWAGHNLNKCSRLCGEARPFGVVIDRDDFPALPRDARGLTAQIRKLRGIGEVAVWVSGEIASQFVPRERLRETPEVHVAGTCFTEDGEGRIRLLLAKRSADRELFPGRFEGCGGQLRHSETFGEGVQRHFRTEMNIDVEVLTDLHCFYEIREAGSPVIPGIRFLCRKVGDDHPSSANHSSLLWVAESEFRAMPAQSFVGGLKRELIELLDRYRRVRQGG
ncbi:class 3 adenylate cyclase/ADP-ribose pyrophosphatase YjhB (NUDIX family) [Thermocatellispora tengchongensis]|uniref:Class 3 adenylate cyclase/ADP-ribose pyrophosphatase YjhB (NUDIX family) n=1 Tax=Thermocatellispora tengchongensis TaxID=1073253 RepID=A0A840P4M2_9ACTN|nr:NUDIX domain-containing protein [Thermocatellispora tengchongensis]MBB5130995.1 class 3 adenylate cyclase/ADP-ribose pyrophosphatase YjhB (NUDIX family) [Thermocatellispora tengchongensis]